MEMAQKMFYEDPHILFFQFTGLTHHLVALFDTFAYTSDIPKTCLLVIQTQYNCYFSLKIF
jgi:hypothetical protein